MTACTAQLRRAITPFPAALETQFLERFRSQQQWSIIVCYSVCGFFFLLGIPAWMQTRIFVAGTEQQQEIPDRDLYLGATLIVDACGVLACLLGVSFAGIVACGLRKYKFQEHESLAVVLCMVVVLIIPFCNMWRMARLTSGQTPDTICETPAGTTLVENRQAHLIILGCANLSFARAGPCCLLGVAGLVASIVTAALHNPPLANLGSLSLAMKHVESALCGVAQLTEAAFVTRARLALGGSRLAEGATEPVGSLLGARRGGREVGPRALLLPKGSFCGVPPRR